MLVRLLKGIVRAVVEFAALYLVPAYVARALGSPIGVPLYLAFVAALAAVLGGFATILRKPRAYLVSSASSLILALYVYLLLEGGVIRFSYESYSVVVNARYLLLLMLVPIIVSALIDFAKWAVGKGEEEEEEVEEEEEELEEWE